MTALGSATSPARSLNQKRAPTEARNLRMSPQVGVDGRDKVSSAVLGDTCIPEASEERGGATAARVCMWAEEGGHS